VLDGIPRHERSYLTSTGIDVCAHEECAVLKSVILSRLCVATVDGFAHIGFQPPFTVLRSDLACKPGPAHRFIMASIPLSIHLEHSQCPLLPGRTQSFVHDKTPPLDRANQEPRKIIGQNPEFGYTVAWLCVKEKVRRFAGTNSDLGSGMPIFSVGTSRHTLRSSPSPTPPSCTALHHQGLAVLST
jgi:hypothetical protein